MKKYILLLIIPFLSFGQEEFKKKTMLGYVANINSLPIGVSIIGLDYFPNSLGMYMDVKTDFNTTVRGEDFSSVYSPSSGGFPGDPFLGEKTNGFMQINIGVIKKIPVKKKLYGYAGLGYGWREIYAQNFDESYILSSSGYYYYYLETEGAINVTFGALYLVTEKLGIQLGYDINPSGLNIGIAYQIR
jgi:hypothetical protein